MLRTSTLGAIAAATVLLGSTVPTAAVGEERPPVAILDCFITPNVGTARVGGTAISYVNAGSTTLHRITFEVDYHTLDADLQRTVDDYGTFAPGKRIDHHFDTYQGESYTSYLPACRAVAAR